MKELPHNKRHKIKMNVGMMLHRDPAKSSRTWHIRKIINRYFIKMEKKPYHCEANIYKCEEMKLENIKINTLFSKINLGLRVYITTMVSKRVWSVNRKIHCFPIWKQVLAQKLTNVQTKKRKSTLGAAYRAFSVLFRVVEYLSITQNWEELSPLRK